MLARPLQGNLFLCQKCNKLLDFFLDLTPYGSRESTLPASVCPTRPGPTALHSPPRSALRRHAISSRQRAHGSSERCGLGGGQPLATSPAGARHSSWYRLQRRRHARLCSGGRIRRLGLLRLRPRQVQVHVVAHTRKEAAQSRPVGQGVCSLDEAGREGDDADLTAGGERWGGRRQVE